MKLSPVVLEDRFVRLEPFTAALEGEVRAAVERRGGGRHDQPV